MSNENKYYISIDIGGTHCRIGLLENKDDGLKLLSKEKFEIHRNFREGLIEIIKHINHFAENKQIVGISIALPGDLDAERGGILSSANLPEWERQPVKKELEERIQIPCFLFHDVAMAAAGEAYYGLGKEFKSFVFLIWGSGFGGAKIEKLDQGLHVTSFEPGHHIATLHGKLCVCGQHGCPEALIGGNQLSKNLHKNLAEVSDDDPIWEKIAEVATQTVANTQAFHPTPLIVFGGGFIEKRKFLLKKIEKRLKEIFFVLEKPQLKLSKLGDDAALYGGVVLQQLKKN